MKDLDKKKVYGILGVAIIFIIVIIVLITTVVGGGSKKITEANLSNAAEKYYAKNPGLLPQNNYDSATISLSALVTSGYLNSSYEGATCPSYVVVSKINDTYTYTPFIKCATDTSTLVSKIMTQVANNGEGLYNIDGKYIFRGENPNNYVKFGDVLWRIVGLDKSNNIKIIYNGVSQYNYWDNKYNATTDKTSGINDYINNEGKSNLYAYLQDYFELFPEVYTGARLSRLAKYDVCVGKANLESNNLNTCSNILQNQLISIITVEDYLNASLDPNCSTSSTKNCQNYNFLNAKGWTITANSDNSYQVYFVDEYEGVGIKDAYMSSTVRPVLALRSDVTYLSGTGSLLDPYIIK